MEIKQIYFLKETQESISIIKILGNNSTQIV